MSSSLSESGSTRPGAFFFLVFPSGISTGFASITLSFILTRAGFSVALAASVVAIGVSANLWRFVFGPVADLTLTARRWYLIGLVTAAATLFVIGFIPLQQNMVVILTTIVFISQVAAALIVLPLGGLMAHTVTEEAKGRASGWYQAGNLGGNGVGGGLGVWLASHYSKEVSSAGMAAVMIASGLAIYFVSDVRIAATEGFGERMRILWRDIWSMLRTAIPLFSTLLVASPIGSGAMNNLWPAVAPDWRASPDTVALVTGVLNGVVCAVGCVFGGWIADRVGRWWSFFGSGVAIALVAIVMGLASKTPFNFTAGVLVYSFFCGMAYAAFSAVVLLAIGRGAASTKYAALSSLGNLPVVYMTALDGWVHDRYGTAWMLHSEALVALVFVVLALVILQGILPRAKTIQP